MCFYVEIEILHYLCIKAKLWGSYALITVLLINKIRLYIDMNKGLRYLLVALGVLVFASCSTTKYVPPQSYLLDEVRIVTDNKEVKPSSLSIYLRQTPNSKWFSLLKTQLYVYNWSGADSTRWINKMFRRMGDAPVIYSEHETRRTVQEMTKAMQNLGYMGAGVEADTRIKGKKLKLAYRVKCGRAYKVRSLHHQVPDTAIHHLMQADSAASLLSSGMRFDVNVLDAERQRITRLLQRNGYYKFNRDYISYTADTVRGTYLVDLTLRLSMPRDASGKEAPRHIPYRIRQVNFVTDYNVMESSGIGGIRANDSIHYNGYPIYYEDKLYLRPKVLFNNSRLTNGRLYNEDDVQRTFANFGRLQALRYTNVRFTEVEQTPDSAALDAYILLTKNRPQSVSLEIEGTNSAGDLGAAAAISFGHRNLFRGSEAFTFKLRGAYEAVSGLQSGAHNQSYIELGAEATINFPRFMFPFLSSDFRRQMRATTELGLQYNYQMRPEFTRIVASTGWSYKWGVMRKKSQHRFDLIDINYLYMPWIDEHFKEVYLNQDQNYILQYNYADRLIVRTGYSFSYNSAGLGLGNNAARSNSHTVRLNVETAGNLLYLLGRSGVLPRNDDKEYTLLNIPFAQYIKADFDYTRNFLIDHRNSMAFHFGLGVAVPYGNATMLPFEKRYFSGGANSVRGWAVRELGPGTFAGDGNFMNQSGDIKLDLNLEYRTHLFWKLHGAAFIDAGNIWTLRSYKEQPGGQFKFNTFYKQIAASYGIGLRLDLDFFIIRFDTGMKAVNPLATGETRWPLFKPDFSRDFAFHFAVGYPF